MTLNPLANPKGVKLLCELCQKPAYYQCLHCRCTYYCSEQHREEDWESIHEKICSVVSTLHATQPHPNSHIERKQRAEQVLKHKESIICVALEEGRKYLCEGQPHLAIPTALQALKMLSDIHGKTDVRLTPAYLILAEAAIELGSLSEASQYLSQAQWAVLKASNQISPLVKSQLHRNLGQLAAARQSYVEARKHFAEDVYQASLSGGPDTVEAAGGYYHMAAVFFKENKSDVALSLHQKVVSIWQAHLQSYLSSLETVLKAHLATETLATRLAAPPTNTDPTPNATQLRHVLHPDLRLGVGQQAEAASMLQEMRQLREVTSDPQLVDIYYCLALLHTLIRDHHKSEEYSDAATRLLAELSSDSKHAHLQQHHAHLQHLQHVNLQLRSYSW